VTGPDRRPPDGAPSADDPAPDLAAAVEAIGTPSPDPGPMAEFGLDEEPDGGVTLREVLQQVGVAPDAIDSAEGEGTLELLAVERLVIPEPPLYDLAQVAEVAGMPADQVEHLWRALGFPDPRPGDKLFTAADVEMMETVVGLVELGVADPDLVVQMARVIGSSLARVANAQIDAFQLTEPEKRDRVDEAFAVQAGALLPTMPKVMDYVWRRHLKAAAERRLVRLADADRADDRQVVGFADLVGFTALSQQVDAHELAAVVDRFETVAYETVAARGGRVVKMIGDEVMFTVERVEPALEIALDLAAAYHDDESLSDVRVGLAVGQVLQREADCYGPVVNRASRIVGIAFPGTVVTDDDVHTEVVGEDGEEPEGFRWRSLHTRNLKDIGKVRLWSVKREGDETPEPSRREKARARRHERGD
jgi:adenylate cyclase